MARKIGITEVALRDAPQSLIATRMPIGDMLPILDKLDQIGYYSLECWGGATFDSCLRFLNEDPWERLRLLRKNCPHTKLQMLFRGQNMLGYRHYADDVLEYFVQRSVANGIDIIRIFDALNDIKNLQTAIRAAKKEGATAQVAISYTTGPVFTTDYYVSYAKQIEESGADSICIKDMAALLTPYKTFELVSALKKAVHLPIQLHTHYTSGLASMCLLKGIEAGADVIDTAISPLALGTSHAPTESMVAALQGTEYDTGLDLKAFGEIREYFMKLRKKYIESGLLDQSMLATNTKALLYQVPGGMLSNLLSQLKQAGKADQLEAVLQEVPRVREDAGYPPLVTPTSQIVGTQAVFNVITGERYKMCTNEFKDLIAGKYGATPMPIEESFVHRIIGDQPRITCRPADSLKPELDTLRKECTQWVEQEEDVLSYAMFPKVATDFFKKRAAAKYGVDAKHADSQAQIHPV
ncbi:MULTISPECIES: oxaloacetate decarboxylase subunit alpha [Caproicibacterium]|uniref:Oxaloacetate decarboxylase subunit alpha n=1 Tax=Caproicibacterium argilliputei TaxID=3030016 RepID=A0AA97D683_9FIRM|nr:oxaloacetate decarboxylase subunit alpha [Caproicibacterium argilliputei]WOC31046.1 oxaloacetate decarboxylase subunit alpha [Caproicibacterium argilliputei]